MVVSRYMHVFGRPAVAMLIPSQGAVIGQLTCRTGYPAEEIAQRVPGCSLTGVDSSPAALELARTKAQLVNGLTTSYLHADSVPTPLPSGAFTHTLSLHPSGKLGDYTALFAEHYRLLCEGGQMVVSLPLRGSYPEIYDMLREYELR